MHSLLSRIPRSEPICPHMQSVPKDKKKVKYAYYNEHDPFAAAWLRNLIAAGHIAPGEVDTRSILDVPPDDLKGFAQCHFFAGIGGWSLALRLAGWPDTQPVWTGSCPCQPFDGSASRHAGHADQRLALGGLANPGLAGREGRRSELSHRRDQQLAPESSRSTQYSALSTQHFPWSAFDLIPCADGKARRIEPGSFPLAHGVPNRVGRLRGYGNAIVPQVAAIFIEAYLTTKAE